MPVTPTDILLDANLLLVLAIGQFDPALLGRKQLDTFAKEDFDLLLTRIGAYQATRTTPHLLAEVSNLADQCVPKRRHRAFRAFFKELVQLLDERWMPAQDLCGTEDFYRLGLADSAVIRLADQQTMVMSVDAELCSVLWGLGINAENFNHFRDTP